MKITRRQLRRIVREEVEKAAPFGSGMEQAELDPDQKEIVGHTWLTHGKVRSEPLREALGIKGNPVGKIVHHDLKENGLITYYDIQIGERIYRDIPSRLVESVKENQHEHEERD